jgi:succinate dehydrogenase flavin-adding protein (antitoxin of CptAB toxin-antitoxin module)
MSTSKASFYQSKKSGMRETDKATLSFANIAQKQIGKTHFARFIDYFFIRLDASSNSILKESFEYRYMGIFIVIC